MTAMTPSDDPSLVRRAQVLDLARSVPLGVLMPLEASLLVTGSGDVIEPDDGLLAIGERPDRWWLLQDWTEPPEPYLGPTTMSFTRMKPVLACELQYLLGQELGLGGGGNAATWVGSLVHDILEQCERGRLPRDLAALRREVERRWDPSQFPSRAIADAQLRLTRDRMLGNWWLTYGARPALAVEQDFSFDIDGMTFTGRIDRIDAFDPDDPNAGTIISDYKTGRANGGKVGEVPDPEHELQLRLYSLAVHLDERLAPFRPVREIAVIFPRGDAADAGPGTDFHSVANQRISITPLQIDLTHQQQIPLVQKWLAQ